MSYILLRRREYVYLRQLNGAHEGGRRLSGRSSEAIGKRRSGQGEEGQNKDSGTRCKTQKRENMVAEGMGQGNRVSARRGCPTEEHQRAWRRAERRGSGRVWEVERGGDMQQETSLVGCMTRRQRMFTHSANTCSGSRIRREALTQAAGTLSATTCPSFSFKTPSSLSISCTLSSPSRTTRSRRRKRRTTMRGTL